MGVEIERKFLVCGEGWRAEVARSEAMEQGYLAHSAGDNAGFPGCSVRVRLTGDSAHLNIKSREGGARRLEFEFGIDAGTARELLEAFCGECVVKTRHHVPYAGAHWEVDEFAGENAGLIVAEIELASVDEPVELPGWVGTELTHDPRFYNLALASAPFSRWPDRNYWIGKRKAC